MITDGDGALITTRSCLLNPNRNPAGGEPRERMIERELTRFGIRRVIWLEGDPLEPVTSGHVDGYVLFTAPGKVLVEVIDDHDAEPPQSREYDIITLNHANDADGRTLSVERIRAPRRRHWQARSKFAAPCYLNVYIANGAVITARFGDPERDEAAQDTFARAFPGREIVMLRIDHIANGGGGIHCLTQPMPENGGNGNE